jgi:hypothetical protein
LKLEQMMGINDDTSTERIKEIKENPEIFRKKIEDFVHGELSEKYEGDNGLDPDKIKEVFGEKFFKNSSYVEHFEKPIIDFSKLPGGDPDAVKAVLDNYIQDDLTPLFEGDKGLDMERITSTFGEKFASNTQLFVKEGESTYFSDGLKDILVDTPKNELANVLGEDAIPALVKYIGDEYGRQVIQSGTRFGEGLIDLLANTTNPDTLARTLGPDAHAQIIEGVKKSITHFGPDSIDTSYVYTLDHYYANQERFLEVQEKLYANFPIMPQWSLKPFVYGLGYVLVIAGITTLLGIKTRISLVIMTLTYMALAYGAGLLASAKTSDPTAFNLLITMLFVHIFMCAYALKLSKHEKLALVK